MATAHKAGQMCQVRKSTGERCFFLALPGCNTCKYHAMDIEALRAAFDDVRAAMAAMPITHDDVRRILAGRGTR